MKRGGPLKRSPLSRGAKGLRRTALERKSPLRATEGPVVGSQAKRAALKQRSGKTAAVQRERAELVRSLVEAGVECEVGPVLLRAGILVRCQRVPSGMHERRKRSSAGSMSNRDNLLAACSLCNGLVEDEPLLVRRLTGTALVVREGDDEWVALGKRADV